MTAVRATVGAPVRTELAAAVRTPYRRLGNHLAYGLRCRVWTSEKLHAPGIRQDRGTGTG